MSLSQKILRLKHWQIFLVTFGLPVVGYIIIMVSIFSNIYYLENDNPAALFSAFRLFPVIMIVALAGVFSWIWSVAMGLQPYLPADIKMKTTRFKIFFFIPLVYILLLCIGMGWFFSYMVNTNIGAQPDPAFVTKYAGVLLIIFPLHFFSIFCIFYCLYFAAKTLKTAELQRTVTFSEFAGEFLLIWFNIIGIWIIQPRLNKLVNTEAPKQQTN